MSIDPKTAVVGFVGLGNMGTPMAVRLAKAGFNLIINDIRPQALDAVRAAVAEVREADPETLAAQVDVLVLILPTGSIVRDFLMANRSGGRSVVEAMRPGSIVIDMSSSEPVGTRELGALLAGHGIQMIDAPVSGGVTRACNGTLAVMTGGDEATVEWLKPLFAAICGPHVHVGELGAGHAMKALNNYVSAAGLMAACEALRAAETFGIDGQRAVDALNASSGRNNSTETKLSQFVLSGTYGSGFTAGLMNKDVGIALGLIDTLGLDAPLARSFVRIWSDATAVLGPESDHTEIAKIVAGTCGRD